MKNKMTRPDIYRRFASVYDRFMTNTPYINWVAYIHTMLNEYFYPQGRRLSIAELACGTGNVTIPLALRGYEMIGVDMSPDMLSEARDKAAGAGADILFLQQDMRLLDLYGTVDAALCVCDGLNYLPDENDLLTVFRKVSLFLNPKGVFIFDMNTEYKFKELYNGRTFTDSRQNASYIWQNRYDPATRTQEYSVKFFVKNGRGESDCFLENHRQRVYPLEKITQLLTDAGFTLRGVNDAYTSLPPKPDSERWSFVAVKDR